MPDPTRIPGPGSYDLPAETYHSDPAPAPNLSSTLARARGGSLALSEDDENESRMTRGPADRARHGVTRRGLARQTRND